MQHPLGLKKIERIQRPSIAAVQTVVVADRQSREGIAAVRPAKGSDQARVGVVGEVIGKEVRDRIAQGLSKPSTGAVKLAGAARPYWEREYDRLTEERYGLFGVLTARSEVYAVRRALVYAFFDRSPEIEEVHLRAAIELVRHSEDSVRHLFGGSLGDPVADRILEELISLAPNGLSRWGISKLFSGNRDRDRISAALAALARLGAVRSERQHGQRGRPVEVWFSC